MQRQAGDGGGSGASSPLRETGLVCARLFRCKVAAFFDSTQIQSRRRKLRDLRPASSGELHVENLCSDQAADRAFVHREEMSTHPVPAFAVVLIVDADSNSQLGLSPKAGPVWRRQSDPRVKVRKPQLSVITIQIHPGLVVRIFTEIVVRQELKTNSLGTRHLVDRAELQPVSSGAHSVRFIPVRRQGAILGAGDCCCDHQ